MLTIVFMTAVLGYLSDEGWQRARAALDEAGRGGSLAVVWAARPADEVHGYWGLWAEQWPGTGPELLAHADFHGAWIEWLA